MSAAHFGKNNFENEVLNASGTVLVDFWAPWCGPCKMLGPVIEELASDFAGKAVVGKVDIDQENDLAAQYGVMTIPTVVIFKNGKEVNRVVGLQSKQVLAQMIERA